MFENYFELRPIVMRMLGISNSLSMALLLSQSYPEKKTPMPSTVYKLQHEIELSKLIKLYEGISGFDERQLKLDLKKKFGGHFITNGDEFNNLAWETDDTSKLQDVIAFIALEQSRFKEEDDDCGICSLMGTLSCNNHR